MLQSTNENIMSSLSAMNKLVEYLKEYRSEKGFDKLVDLATDLSNKLKITPAFKAITEIRQKKEDV